MYMVKSIGKNLLTFLLFVYAVFPIYFLAPTPVLWKALYYGIPIVYVLCNFHMVSIVITRLFNNKDLRIALFLFFLYLVDALIVILLRSQNISIFIQIGAEILACFRGMALTIFLYKNFNHDTTVLFLRFFIYAGIFYVMTSIIFLTMPDLRVLWLQFIANADSDIVDTVNNMGLYVSRFGLQGYSGFKDTILCTMGVLFSIILKAYYRCKLLYFSVPILILGNMFYGRSGLVVSICLVCVYTVATLSTRTVIKAGLFTIIVIGAIAWLIAVADEIPYIGYWLQWVTEPLDAFITGIQQGRLSFGSSNDVMRSMYFLPSEDLTVIFGDGIYMNSDGSYYGHTDVGPMRNMLFGGVVSVLLLYSSVLLFLYCVSKKLSYSVLGKNSRVLFFLILIFVVAFESKGDAILIHIGYFFAILVSLMLTRRKKTA